eukprot:gene12605-biopygen10044
MQTDARWMPLQPFQFFPQPLPQPQQMQQGAVQPADEQAAAPAIPQQNANPPPQNHDLHRMAPMNNVCTHCGAKYFKEELNTKKKYTKCCREGAVHLPAIQPPPAVLMPLFLARLGPLPGQQPKYAELYIMDTAEALEHRTNNPTNRDLNKDTIKKLQDELLAVNPYAQEYKNIGDILQQQKEQATSANEPIRTFDMIITSRANQDRRCDTPAASEIAAIYSTKDGGAPDPNERTMHIQRCDGYLINIKATNPAADPLTYPLLFPFGEHGWGTTIARLPSARSQIPADQAERRQTRVTPSQFYTYRIQVREGFSVLHLSRLLFQQYLVDAFTKIEGNDLAYIRYHQKDLTVESYKGLMDHLYRRAEQQNLIAQAHNPGAAQHNHVGRVIILPCTFTGSQ